jgi:hypothetical protein
VEKKDCSECDDLPHQFKASSSSSFKNLAVPISSSVTLTQYGDGSGFSGTLSTDVILVGDSGPLSATGYFVLVNTDSGNKGMSFDGLLGLGFSSLSDGYATLMDSLKNSGVIQQRVFALYLNAFASAKYPQYGNPSSNLMIGGYDLAMYSTPSSFIMTLPVINTGFWEAIMTSFSINGQVVQLGMDVIFDSGTTGIVFETSVMTKVVSAFTANTANQCQVDQGYLICSCKNVSDMMALTLEYNGRQLVFNANRLWTMLKGKACMMNVESGDIPSMMLLGDYFLTSYYVVYDMDNMQVSFAPAVAANKTSALSWAKMIVLAVGLSMII